MNRRDFIRWGASAGIIGAGAAAFEYYRHPGRLALPGTSGGVETRRHSVHFSDVTSESGIFFEHNSGAFGKKYLPETLGSGCAFFDYDNDGWLDILLINGKDWPGHFRRRTTMKLYKNNRNGTFTDVTRRAGLDVELYGIGVAIGDYNNDGFDDVYITTYGQNRLFRNNRNGTFTDVTRAAGIDGYSGLSTSALWFDYDRDGHLDLLVGNYVQWSPETDIYCSIDGRHKSYCTPEAYPGATCWLFHNRGDGTFEDVTGKSGLHDSTSKSLGLTLIDYDMDGWPDIFIANDTQPNKLYHNERDGTFQETAVSAGVAFSEDGVARAGMGADAADYDNSGLPSLVVTNFSQQMVGLYQNEGHGFFIDKAPESAVGQSTRMTLGFGCFFFDYDLDGNLDLLVANGHIDADIARVDSSITYAEPPRLFHNEGNSRFQDVERQAGQSFSQPKVARGAAYGDFDNDGNLDVLMTTNNGPAYLYRNESICGHSIRFCPVGERSNRDGMGAVIRIWTPEGMRWLTVKSGSSYLSSSDRRITFGLGPHKRIERAVLEWPSGTKQELGKLEAGRSYTVHEQKGVIADTAYCAPHDYGRHSV